MRPNRSREVSLSRYRYRHNRSNVNYEVVKVAQKKMYYLDVNSRLKVIVRHR